MEDGWTVGDGESSVGGRRMDAVLSSDFSFMISQNSMSTVARTIISAVACPVPFLLLGA